MAADQINGYWISPDKDLIVKCFKGTDGKYYGKVSWYKIYPNDKTTYDCDISQDLWIGKIVLSKFVYQDNEWSGGYIQDLKKCRTYDAFITSDANGNLRATGFVFFRFLSESVTFTKYEGELPELESSN